MTATVVWDRYAAELQDVREQERARKTKRPCRYCGQLTYALSGVCPAHDDLPRLEQA